MRGMAWMVGFGCGYWTGFIESSPMSTDVIDDRY